MPHHLLECFVTCVLGRAVFIVLEALIPNLVQNPQYYFPIYGNVFLETGSVFAFGENKMGQLGLGNQTDAVPSPAQVLLPLTGGPLGFSWFLCLIFWDETVVLPLV